MSERFRKRAYVPKKLAHSLQAKEGNQVWGWFTVGTSYPCLGNECRRDSRRSVVPGVCVTQFQGLIHIHVGYAVLRSASRYFALTS
jgi:hypothetical protein